MRCFKPLGIALLKKSFYLGLMLLGFSCTSPESEKIPPEQVMHYPYGLSLKDNILAISSTSTDGKYSHGRLVTVDAKAIKAIVSGNEPAMPIDWSKVVLTNVLTPLDVGKIVISKNAITFAERQQGSIISIPADSGGTLCKDPFMRAEKCPDSTRLSFFESAPEQDTFGLEPLSLSDDKDTFLVSYLSFDGIDVVSLDKTGDRAMGKVRHFSGADLLRANLDAKALQKRRAVTKAMAVSFLNDSAKSKVYLLLELHYEKNLLLNSPRSLHLLSIKVSDLLADNLELSKIESLDLTKTFNILGVRDLFIDEAKEQAVLLATSPASLFKIDLAKKTVIKTNTVCVNAASMAVNKAKDLVVVPCSSDEQLMSFSLSGLDTKSSSDMVGRLPSYAVIDEANELVYCSFYVDGTVGIFDLKLKYLGHLFNKAPINRSGS